MNSLKNPGRFAGVLYLLIIISGIFAEIVVRGAVKEPGNAPATATNILASESLFRFSLLSDFVMIMSYFALGIVFYHLFKSTNKHMALLLLTLNLIGVPMMALNMLNQFSALLVLTDVDYLQAFTTDQLHSLSLFFMNLHGYGYQLTALSYGSWLFPLGYVVYQSTFLPKVIGVFLMVASVAILCTFATTFVAPQHLDLVSMIESIPSVIGEFSLCLWLLIKGVRKEQLKSIKS
ncbi:DUF4386 domain-containing protein [Bacillus sp. 2205SS5-2]|uniref:DUF4386 domain-containing protein n=1 Tax=Bacillus sp. 2205SS5-2 TaxID=3109031 RepID=UPI0030076021